MLGPGAWLLYVPAARNPLKAHGPEAPDAERLNMLRLLIAEPPPSAERVSIWTDEIDRARAFPGPTYTIDTVSRLRSARPDLNIRLLIGSDQAIDFHRWRSARDLIDQTRPLVMLREPLGTMAALKQALAATGAWAQPDIDAWLSRTAPTEIIDISSSALRTLLHAPTPDRAALQTVLTPTVLAYIEQHKLYR
jgi:nicotinate-nucleotide adenylyltransferase